jgi:hypothetical protein
MFYEHDDDEGQIVPWADDLAYIQDELLHVEVRCRRLALERRRDANPEERTSRRNSFSFDEPEKIEPHVLAKQIAEARAREADLRGALDARLVVHRATGTFELALDRLGRVHGIGEFGRTVLILAAGSAISKKFDKLYAGLEGDRQSNLTVEVIFTYLGLSVAERIARRASLGPRSALVRSGLLDVFFAGRTPTARDLLSVEVELRGRGLDLLLGAVGLGDELADLVRLEDPRATFAQVVLPDASRQRISAVIDGHARLLEARETWGLDEAISYGRGVVLLFDGAPGTGKTLTAHAVADRLGCRVMNVDLATFFAHEKDGEFLVGLFREIRLLGNVVPFFEEADQLFASRNVGNPFIHILLTEIEKFDGLAILATSRPELIEEALWRRILVRIHFGRPDRTARAAIWRCLLPSRLPLSEDVDLDRLSEIDLTGGEIKNAVLVAAATSAYEAPDLNSAKVTHAMLEAAAKEQGEGRRLTRADHVRLDREADATFVPGRRRPTGFA